MAEERKEIEVVAALVLDDAGRVLATQCPPHKHDGGWEFPGGKVEPGEAPEAALVREMAEELALHIRVGRLLQTVRRDYSAYRVNLHCFLCRVLGGELTLHEHQAARWLAAEELDAVPWLPADADILPALAEVMRAATEPTRRAGEQ